MIDYLKIVRTMDQRRRGTRRDGQLLSGVTGTRQVQKQQRVVTKIGRRPLPVVLFVLLAHIPALMSRFALTANFYTNSSMRLRKT